MYYQQSCEAVPSKADGKLVFLQLLRGRSKTQTKKTQTWRRCLLSCVLRLSECESSLSPCQPFQQQWKKKKKCSCFGQKLQFLLYDSSWLERSWRAWRWLQSNNLSRLWCMSLCYPRAAACTPCFPCTICCACCNVKYCQTHTHTLSSIQKAWLSAPVSRASQQTGDSLLNVACFTLLRFSEIHQVIRHPRRSGKMQHRAPLAPPFPGGIVMNPQRSLAK